MDLQQNQDEYSKIKNEIRASDPRILDGLLLDVSSAAFGSPAYYATLVDAVRHLKGVSGALLPLSTADALSDCGLVTIRHRKSCTPGSFVHPRFTDAGERIAIELANAAPDVKPYILQSMRELARLKATSASYVVGLSVIHRLSQQEGSEIRSLRKLTLALQALKEKPLSDSKVGFFAKRREEMLVELNTRKMLGAPTLEERQRGVEWLRMYGNFGDTPVAPEYPERKQALITMARSIFRRSDLYGGNFWRYSGDTMAVPGLATNFTRMQAPSRTQHSLMSLFASECFKEACFLHSSDPNATPGRGIFFSQPRFPALFYGADNTGNLSSESVQKYEVAFSGMPGVLNDFRMASFAMLRGGILVQVPGTGFSVRLGKGVPPVHYTLFIPNDHLTGNFERAYLIPSSRINIHVINAKYSFDKKPSEDTGDLANSILAGDRLVTTNTAPYVIGLSNISAMFSGLVGGLPLRAEPLFSWENGQGITSGWRDIREHVHYRWYLSEKKITKENSLYSEDERVRKRDEFLYPFEKASIEIGAIASRLLNVLDVMLHRFAAWKHDLVPQPTPIPRLAKAFYGFHRLALEWDAPSTVPQLCIVDRHNHSIRPRPIGDPSTLTVLLDGEPRILPPAGVPWDTAELLLWRQAVAGHAHQYSSHNGVVGRTETDSEIAFIKTDYL